MFWMAWSVAALLVAVTAAGLWVVCAETARLRATRGNREHLSAPSRIAEYVGPVDRSQRPLTAPLRVLAEAGVALCGFPGIGWLVSGHIMIGLTLLVVVPASLWAFYPLYVSVRADPGFDPLVVLWVLPPLSAFSASALAVTESRQRHRA